MQCMLQVSVEYTLAKEQALKIEMLDEDIWTFGNIYDWGGDSGPIDQPILMYWCG